jgi:hypothetical protein
MKTLTNTSSSEYLQTLVAKATARALMKEAGIGKTGKKLPRSLKTFGAGVGVGAGAGGIATASVLNSRKPPAPEFYNKKMIMEALNNGKTSLKELSPVIHKDLAKAIKDQAELEEYRKMLELIQELNGYRGRELAKLPKKSMAKQAAVQKEAAQIIVKYMVKNSGFGGGIANGLRRAGAWLKGFKTNLFRKAAPKINLDDYVDSAVKYYRPPNAHNLTRQELGRKIFSDTVMDSHKLGLQSGLSSGVKQGVGVGGAAGLGLGAGGMALFGGGNNDTAQPQVANQNRLSESPYMPHPAAGGPALDSLYQTGRLLDLY